MVRSKNVDSWISEHDPAIRQIAEALWNVVLSADASLNETIKPTFPRSAAWLRRNPARVLPI